MISVHNRKYFTFISHAHADKKVVDEIFRFLKIVAGIPVWYDANDLPPGTQIATFLGEALSECRSMIIILSKASISSGWVKQEYDFAIGQRTSTKGAFTIIPIQIEECQIPEPLQFTKRIENFGSELSIESASEILLSLHEVDVDLELRRTKDVYVSCSWRSIPEREFQLSSIVCSIIAKEGIRLIGDSKDQKGFGDNRVESIISSCGALVAILPDRGEGNTSPYMIKEVEFAVKLDIPYIIITEKTVDLPELMLNKAFDVVRIEEEALNPMDLEKLVLPVIQLLKEEWIVPRCSHYVFFGTSIAEQHKYRNQIIKRLIERVVAMPCVMGEEIREGKIQETIREMIISSFLVIADISDENLNTCIEAGIACGAKRPLHLISSGPRRSPAFLFRDQQIWYYSSDIEILGKIHAIVFPYRRRIINYELSL